MKLKAQVEVWELIEVKLYDKLLFLPSKIVWAILTTHYWYKQGFVEDFDKKKSLELLRK